VGVKSLVKQVLIEEQNRRYERLLRGRKISYGEWAAALEARRKGDLSFPERSADRCGFVVIRAGSGASAPGMYQAIEEYFSVHPEVLLLYGDEDVCDGAQEGEAVLTQRRRLPWFKPDWSPDLLDSFFYFGSITALREELFGRTQAAYEDICRGRGEEPGRIFRPAGEQGAGVYEAADFRLYEEWIHLCVRLAGGYEKGNRAVGHLAQILFHCRSAEEQGKFLRPSPFFKDCGGAIPEVFSRQDTVWKPIVSIIIPSKDHPEILQKCLRGCVLAAEGRGGEVLPFEVILVDNGSSAGNRGRVQEIVEKLAADGYRISYFYRPQEFNFSRLCNLGAAQAEGELLLFLNDDVELCRPGCLESLAALAGREYTGAVGMKLYYPDSLRIQHAGVTNLPMGPVHKLQFQEDDREYYYGANRGRRNVLAVTAACLMTAKEKYLEAGGFAEELKVAFNDVDFCFRLYELGYQNVCVNDMYAYHHESLSRGTDEAPEKLNRLLGERERLYGRHPGLEGRDPYYSPYLGREGLDTGIRPAYLTAGNAMQKVERCPVFRSLKRYRQDACLMVRVEDCRGGRIVGYGVVLGDNNACYERELLLWRQEGSEGGKGGYAVRLAGQYRPDLEENLPDQVNAALCGFLVEIGEGVIPAGRYRIGMAARSRVTGLGLVNWSGRTMEL